jgi:hypothetical protein
MNKLIKAVWRRFRRSRKTLNRLPVATNEPDHKQPVKVNRPVLQDGHHRLDEVHEAARQWDYKPRQQRFSK